MSVRSAPRTRYRCQEAFRWSGGDGTLPDVNGAQGLADAVEESHIESRRMTNPPPPTYERLFTWTSGFHGVPLDSIVRWSIAAYGVLVVSVLAIDGLLVDDPHFTSSDGILMLGALLFIGTAPLAACGAVAAIDVKRSLLPESLGQLTVRRSFRTLQLDLTKGLAFEQNGRRVRLMGTSTDGQPVRIISRGTRHPHPYFYDGVDELCSALDVPSPVSTDQLLQVRIVDGPTIDPNATFVMGRRFSAAKFGLQFLAEIAISAAILFAIRELYGPDVPINLSASILIPWLVIGGMSRTSIRIDPANPAPARLVGMGTQPRRLEIHHLPTRSLVYLRVADSMYPRLIDELHAHNRRGMTAADRQKFETQVRQFAAASHLGPPVITTPGAAA